MTEGAWPWTPHRHSWGAGIPSRTTTACLATALRSFIVSDGAVFESDDPAWRGADPTVAWFQDQYTIPIGPKVEEQVHAVAWDLAGKDWTP